MKNISVIGAGTMGNGIAHVLGLHGFNTLLIDNQQDAITNALSIIEQNLYRQVKKEHISENDKNSCLHHIHTSLNPEDAGSSDLVIEAVTEKLEVKSEIFRALENIVRNDCVIASNTSSISITRLASSTNIPERVIGMHFMNPVPLMPLVEVIKGLNTKDHVIDKIADLSHQLGKTPVIARDYPGFVSNRILMPMINEAIYARFENVAGTVAIDQVMQLGMSHPMGPLKLADFIGLDVCLNILNVLYEGFKLPKYAPCPLLVNMVNAGLLGAKTNEGFYIWENKKPVRPSDKH